MTAQIVIELAGAFIGLDWAAQRMTVVPARGFQIHLDQRLRKLYGDRKTLHRDMDTN